MSRPRPEAPLSAGQKIAYGIGDLAQAIRITTFQFAMLPFFTDVVLLAPWLAGLAKTLGLVWDGVNDPILGYVSDRTRTRFGRRRPFLLGAAVPLGLTFALLWMPPAGVSQALAFGYLVLAYVVLDTCFTCYATPYLALGAELSEDYHERTQLSAVRSFFHVVGLFIGGTLPFAVIARYPGDHATGYAVMGACIGGLMTVAVLVTGFFVREPPPRASHGEAERASWRTFVHGLTTTLQNKPFRILLLTFAVIQVGGGIHQILVPYAFTYWLGRQDLVSTVIAIYMAAFLVSIPLWTRLAHVLGKDRALKLCMLWAATALALLPLLLSPTMGYVRLVPLLIVAGLGNGGWAVLPVAITADVIDTDELDTARRREGAYFGVWTLALKLATAIASGLVGFGLQLVGYVPNATQSATAVLGIRLLYGPLPSLFILAGLAVFAGFPLTRERHAEVRAALVARRKPARNGVPGRTA